MRQAVLLWWVVVWFSATRSHAQAVQVGVKLGGTVSHFVGSAVSFDPHPRVTPMAGLAVQAPLSARQRWRGQVEVNYVSKGYEARFRAGHTRFLRTKLQYLEVPLLLQWHLHRFFVEAGPQASYLLNAQLQEDVGSRNRTFQFTAWDVGYLAGLGMRVGARLQVGARYNGGWRNVYRKEWGDNTARNIAYQLQATYFVFRAAP